MAQQQQPFNLQFNGSTTPVQRMPDGTTVGADDDAGDAILFQGQRGPAQPVTPQAVPLDFTVPTVLTPYSVTMPPGVQPG